MPDQSTFLSLLQSTERTGDFFLILDESQDVLTEVFAGVVSVELTTIERL